MFLVRQDKKKIIDGNVWKYVEKDSKEINSEENV